MERIKSGLWVQALLWRLDRQALAVVIRRRGDVDSGSILLKISYLNGTARILSQVQDGAGRSVWMSACGADPVSEEKAEAYLTRSLDIDPDQWVVEIEDPKGRFAPDEPTL
jgi:hypothetical protein